MSLDPRERDYLLLSLYVLAQQGYVERAGAIAEAMRVMGESALELAAARAVLHFLKGEWRQALACLDEYDRLDPVERFGSYRLTEMQRLRRYLRARCLHELAEPAQAREAVERYLRLGSDGPDRA
jgi:tetratricopeptide (TPR) repeat protein